MVTRYVQDISKQTDKVIENSIKSINKSYSDGYTVDDFIKGTSSVAGRAG